MRHRSKTNSRKWENLELRFQYMQENPACELAPYLIKHVPGLRKQETATDPHHLVGGNGRRWDLRTNLLAVCRPVHRWCHDHLQDSRVLGIWLKVRKGEFDRDEFRTASGKNVEGFLDIARPDLPAIEVLRKELIWVFERAE